MLYFKIPFRMAMVLILLFCGMNVRAQKEVITDPLIEKICKTMDENPSAPDSVRISMAFQKHLPKVFAGLSESEQNAAWDRLFYRLQRNCVSFREMMMKLNPTTGSDWEQVDSKPAPQLKAAECRRLPDLKNLAWRQASGDTVQFSIRNGIWTERFQDGTSTRLKFKWINECEFELEFIESNNNVGKNLSVRGDKYRYQLLTKEDGYYSASAEAVGRPGFMTFRIYFSE